MRKLWRKTKEKMDKIKDLDPTISKAVGLIQKVTDDGIALRFYLMKKKLDRLHMNCKE